MPLGISIGTNLQYIMRPLLIVADHPPVRDFPDLGEALTEIQIQDILPMVSLNRCMKA